MKANSFISRNLMMILAGVLVVAMGIMAYLTYTNFGKGAKIPDEATQELEVQGTSSEVSDIEKDLEETNFEDLDKEVVNIEAELNLP